MYQAHSSSFQEGYAGPKCDECSPTYYPAAEGGRCVPCPCGDITTTCSVEPFRSSTLEDSSEFGGGYVLGDVAGGKLEPGERLAVIEYEGDDAVLMVDLSAVDEYSVLHLPSPFLGELSW